ncbi:hypothetical protein [Candidatus Solirubrobacter pratensis]|uniref:hypothetical protein n=1 Tax=Candidatus Solirubrobacter pratensis TaxID=1298857 RepID=UPI000414F372|nr:hypothetical protein [Candidatus Solirubrobacter pratensis]
MTDAKPYYASQVRVGDNVYVFEGWAPEIEFLFRPGVLGEEARWLLGLRLKYWKPPWFKRWDPPMQVRRIPPAPPATPLERALGWLLVLYTAWTALRRG